MNYICRYEILDRDISVIHTISIGNIMRLSVMSCYGKNNNHKTSRTLSGKDQNGVPLSGHMHVFYIPTDEDYDGFLDHINVMTNSELDQEEIDAITSVKRLYSGGPQIDMNLRLCDDKPDILTATNVKWISATPFVLYRHTKKKHNVWQDTPKEQLENELKRRSYSLNIKRIIMQNNKNMKVSRLMPEQFKRTRKTEPEMPAYEAMIEFTIPVSGPLLLGHGCHFGLGMFVPYVEK